jgi:hypothetical protein
MSYGRSIAVLALVAVAGACGTEAPTVVDAGGLDASGGLVDAGLDATTAEDDASEPTSDAGPPDADGDGVRDDIDCAPDDPSIGATSARACTNECGSGMETCADGVWSACDAPTSCLCATPDATRITACGACGMQSQRCSDGVWVNQGSCIGEGECTAGAVEMEDLSDCTHRERLCTAECTWTDWDSTRPPEAECSAGLRFCQTRDGVRGIYRCNDMCMWVYESACP